MTMLDEHHETVYCNNYTCSNSLKLQGEDLSNAQVRQAILDQGWYIDITSPSQAILLGNEDGIATGLPKGTLEKIISNPAAKLADDQHYCSLQCAQEDA